MEVTIKGKQIDVGSALSTHVEDNLVPAVSKYFDKALDALVVFSKPTHDFHVDITVHAGRGITMQGKADASDAHAAFDAALDRISKQLRRYKRKLTDHHSRLHADEMLPAQYSILETEKSDEELQADYNPAIVAEMPHEIGSMSVSEAVMRLDLGGLTVFMFRNAGHGGMNVVYRRPDGNIGWIDPQGGKTS